MRDPWISKLSAFASSQEPRLTMEERALLHQQHLQSHLMKMACYCLASHLNLSQLHHLNVAFKRYDTSGDGQLNHMEMRQVLADVGAQASEIEFLIQALDSDHSGNIEYSEFIAASIDIANDDLRNQLRIVFNIFDLDNSGAISFKELAQVLHQGPKSTELQKPLRPTLVGDEFGSIMAT